VTRLRELAAEFLALTDEPRTWRRLGDSMAGADGITFLCPACFAANGGPRGTHAVICWFRGRVPDDLPPVPGRWTPAGTGLDDLTFVPGDPPMATSVLLTGPGCGWHGFVTNGSAA